MTPLRPGRRALLASLAGAAAAGTPRARAQAFPSRPIRIVVPFGAGGIADLTARTLAQALAEDPRWQLVVENRPGAGGVVAAQQVAKAEPDGHTLLLMSNGTAVSASLFRSLPYDPLRDFAPVCTIGSFALAIAVPGDSRFATLAELLRFARAQPGKLNVGTVNVGSTQHLAAELFRSSAGVDLQVVPFNGTPALLAALAGGHVDAAFEIVGPALSQSGGRPLRVLAVTSERRSPLLPDTPTVHEAALPGYKVASWNAIAAPARTPGPVVAALNAAVHRALAAPPAAKRLRALGVDVHPGTPDDLARLLASEVRRWSAVIEAARIEKQ
jgi:tripartite-type tricarboxylate transporter receptor subunit TctC